MRKSFAFDRLKWDRRECKPDILCYFVGSIIEINRQHSGLVYLSYLSIWSISTLALISSCSKYGDIQLQFGKCIQFPCCTGNSRRWFRVRNHWIPLGSELMKSIWSKNTISARSNTCTHVEWRWCITQFEPYELSFVLGMCRECHAISVQIALHFGNRYQAENQRNRSYQDTFHGWQTLWILYEWKNRIPPPSTFPPHTCTQRKKQTL